MVLWYKAVTLSLKFQKLFVGGFRQLWKAVGIFVMKTDLSVCMEQLASYWTGFKFIVCGTKDRCYMKTARSPTFLNCV